MKSYDSAGDLILSLIGEVKAGGPQNSHWTLFWCIIKEIRAPGKTKNRAASQNKRQVTCASLAGPQAPEQLHALTSPSTRHPVAVLLIHKAM